MRIGEPPVSSGRERNAGAHPAARTTTPGDAKPSEILRTGRFWLMWTMYVIGSGAGGATIARERGLEPLAETFKAWNALDHAQVDLVAEATKFIDEEKEVLTAEDALKGASDILAEELAEKIEELLAIGGTQTVPASIKALREDVTDKPIRYGVLTHHHNDHTPGAAAYAQVKSVALL